MMPVKLLKLKINQEENHLLLEILDNVWWWESVKSLHLAL